MRPEVRDDPVRPGASPAFGGTPARLVTGLVTGLISGMVTGRGGADPGAEGRAAMLPERAARAVE